jgi:AmmeMemoRadiSam system protein B/AmmeMemoRadiSam system protein A
MNNRVRPYLFALAGAVILGAIVFGIFYDNREPKRPVQVVKLPPADYLAASSAATAAADESELTVRAAAAAGEFYSSDSQELAEEVEGLLTEAEQAMPADLGTAWLAIGPHAGYEYSGHLAARTALSLKRDSVYRVVLVGRSHQKSFSQVLADGNGYWQTPLGRVTVDRTYLERLRQDSGVISYDSAVHQDEHSLEVFVPLLQKVIGDRLTIVPLLLGDDEEGATAATLGRSLARLIDDHTAVIVSTDLSHYPTAEQAAEIDGETVAAILSGDPSRWRREMADRADEVTGSVQTLACAAPAVEAGLVMAQRLGLTARQLGYGTSADQVPDTADRAVGYLAAAFTGWLPQPQSRPLTSTEQHRAAQIARQAIENLFSGLNAVVRPSSDETIFDQRLGAFVTLKRSGQLRGCIGRMIPDGPLAETIRFAAVAAASADSRFSPLSAEERTGLEIEVSVLSPMRPISDPSEIQPGTHGVWLTSGLSSGVFLPQVATENNWTGWEELLDELCIRKAELGRGCWKDSATTLKVFTAEVFSEPYYPESGL